MLHIFIHLVCGVLRHDLNRAFACLVLCLAGTINVPRAQAESPIAAPAARIVADLTYLASDELAGRGIGTDGIAKAGDFIAQRYQELGLQTDAFGGTPFQNFDVPMEGKLGAAERNRLVIEIDSPTKTVFEFELGKDFNPLSLGSSGAFRGGLVFAGYGITAPDLGYDDFAGVQVEGKVVIVIRKEPQQNDRDSKFSGTRSSEYAYFTSKELNAAKHKAAALILVNDAQTIAAANLKLQNDIDNRMTELELLKSQRPSDQTDTKAIEKWTAQTQSITAQLDSLRTRQQQGVDTVLGVSESGSAISDKQLPTFFCTRKVIDPIIQAALGKNLAQLEVEIDSDLKPRSIELAGSTARGEVQIETQQVHVRNVIGVLPGKGDLTNQYVVVGAHYDHVGMGGPGSLAPGTIEVHNGADDNGSGTVALLDIARRCAANSISSREQRSIIFMAFTGEEWGLKGSKHYVANPRWSLENTVAMINLDMVGRLTNDELTVYGTGTASGFSQQIDRLNELHKFKIVKEPAGRGPSDHQSFYEAKIPVFHFFTGIHNDYHRPSDDVDRINVAGIVRVSEMVTDLVTELAQQPVRPEVQMIAGTARPRNQARRRAVLGVSLSTTQDNQVAVEQLIADGPADKAGVLAGDVLLEIDGTAIRMVPELLQALSTRKSGDEVTLIILRSGERKEIRAKLGTN